MGSYTIGQVAERSGFSATALRYYEGIGLVMPAGRSDAGYRLYDDRSLARLSFIARAKQLGCTLEEITELVDVWNGDRCAPVQNRLHGLVTRRLRAAEHQIDELVAFTTQLHAAAAQLGTDPIDGPCAEDCACLGSELERQAGAIACKLEAGELPGRLDDWGSLLAYAERRLPLPSGGMRIEFAADEGFDVGTLARLVASEQHCCSFFRFAITVDARGIGLEVDAPREAAEHLTSMFGSNEVHPAQR